MNEYEIAHYLGQEIEYTVWQAESPAHAIEQWNDYVKDIGDVEFYTMTRHRG
jgi:hypothetical protein